MNILKYLTMCKSDGGNFMPKISVIVPVYNVEKFLKKSLDSIINQTFSDFELICINDESPEIGRAHV